MSKRLDVSCTPGTFKKLEEDMEYRTIVSQQVMGNEEYDEIIFTPNGEVNISSLVASCDNTCELPTASDVESKTLWLDASTKLLISLIKQLRPKVGKIASLKNKRQMWHKISDEMKNEGYCFNSAQVEAKYFSLERQYKRMKLHNNKTGRNKITCPFQTELDDLFINKRSIEPEFVIDSETPVVINETSNNNENDSDNSECTPPCLKRRKTVMEKYLEKVDEQGKRREENDEKLHKMLEENFRRKEERAKRREEIETKKVFLLESIANLLKKD